MSNKIETVSATLDISMWVDCPNDKCRDFINLLEQRDTNHHDHNDCGDLLQQVFPDPVDNSYFECDRVVCSKCKTEFNVRGLCW